MGEQPVSGTGQSEVEVSHVVRSRLEDEWSIRRTLERYCRYVDDNDFLPLVDLFTEDAVLEFGGQRLAGREQIGSYFRDVHGSGGGPAYGVHLLGGCLIDLDGDEARASTDFVHVWRVGAGDGQDATAVLAGQHLGQIPISGRYVDLLRLAPTGGWLVAHRASALFATSPVRVSVPGE